MGYESGRIHGLDSNGELMSGERRTIHTAVALSSDRPRSAPGPRIAGRPARQTGSQLNELAMRVHTNAVNKQWWGPTRIDGEDDPEMYRRAWRGEERVFSEVCALIHSETSEALEEWRNGKGLNETYWQLIAISGVENRPANDIRVSGTGRWEYRLNPHLYGPSQSEEGWAPLTWEDAQRLGFKAEPHGIPVELADILIRVLDACGAYGIDIDQAVAEKMEYNLSRPDRHGGKRA